MIYFIGLLLFCLIIKNIDFNFDISRFIYYEYLSIKGKLRRILTKYLVADSKEVIICRGCGIFDSLKDTNWSIYNGEHGNDIFNIPMGDKWYCCKCIKNKKNEK